MTVSIGPTVPLTNPTETPTVLGAMHTLINTLVRRYELDPRAPGLEDTPRRVMEMYDELLAGYKVDLEKIFTTFDAEGYSGIVIVRDIPFYSMCEHHLVPFFGVAHVGYIPRGRVVGLSKLARVVEAFARRLQMQERMTDQIADTLDEYLQPNGVFVVVRAEHLCMAMRGVQRPGASTVTSAIRGQIMHDSAARSEFLSLISRS